jgi:hypothetical protein
MLDSKEECWRIHGMWRIFTVFTFKEIVKIRGLVSYK